MTRSPGIVIVGASAAGLAAAEELRRQGHDGGLTLVGDEPHLPYDRPPLSKQLLCGAWEPEKLRLRAPDVYADLRIEQRLGVRAESLDVGRHQLRLTGGDILDYTSLVVATGARARMLPGPDDTAGVHVLRTLDDALALRGELASRPHLVIVGGGFVGAETAAVARALGCEVTLVTSGPVPLADTVGEDIGGLLSAVHREHGVRVVAGTRVTGIRSDGGRATGVRLADGSILDAQAVLVGIGARPNTEWLADSGLSLTNGVDCDPMLRAAEDVWAAGDVASWQDAVSGERMRVEHRTHATEQGMAVARNILAPRTAAAAFTSVPFVWSDQYDLKVQIHGRTRGADEVHIVDGSLDERKFTALYACGGHITAALGINMVRPLRNLRPLVAAHTPVDQALAGLSVSV